MDLCTSFATSTDCILEYSNLYNIKLLTLLIVGLIFFYIYHYRENIAQRDYVDYWLYHLAKVIPILYFIFIPILSLFLLRNTITYEIFILIIVGFYGLFFAIFTGLSVYYGQLSVWKIFGFRDFSDFKEKSKRMRSERDYE